jgi:hypothetical protein
MSRRWLLLAAAVLVLNASLWLASGVMAGPLAGIGDYFFGPKLVRAEVVMFDGTLQDWRIDRGRIRSTAGHALTLRERDGTLVTIPVAPDAKIDIGGRSVVFERLRNGMQATTIRLGDDPASTVKASLR